MFSVTKMRGLFAVDKSKTIKHFKSSFTSCRIMSTCLIHHIYKLVNTNPIAHLDWHTMFFESTCWFFIFYCANSLQYELLNTPSSREDCAVNVDGDFHTHCLSFLSSASCSVNFFG